MKAPEAVKAASKNNVGPAHRSTARSSAGHVKSEDLVGYLVEGETVVPCQVRHSEKCAARHSALQNTESSHFVNSAHSQACDLHYLTAEHADAQDRGCFCDARFRTGYLQKGT